MDLQQVVERYSQALSSLDATLDEAGANPRTGVIYLPGVKSVAEASLVKAIDNWWASNHPDELHEDVKKRLGVPYPDIKYAKCDHVLNTDHGDSPEWAIEVKKIALVGENGKRNDFAVSKILSPFLKDRSLLHDVVRLRTYPIARRHAVVGYTFNYDQATCDTSEKLHPTQTEVIRNIRDVCITNGGEMNINPLLEFADGILRVRGLITGIMCEAKFEAWRHPSGGRGLVFGWEVRRPEMQAQFDPRHPW